MIAASGVSVAAANFGADRLTDRRHAERVADVPGVRLFPMEGCAEHIIFSSLIDRGRAGEIFTV